MASGYRSRPDTCCDHHRLSRKCHSAGECWRESRERNLGASTTMRVLHTIALAVLALILIAALGASVFAPAGYAKQFRDRPNVPPSSRFLLGTDELGRDRFSRLLFATRISLLLAPAAGALSTVLAAVIGTVAGFLGGIWERLTMAVIDVLLSLPWLFLLIAV